MWPLGTGFSYGHGNAGIMVGLDLKGLFQPNQFYDSVISCALIEKPLKVD